MPTLVATSASPADPDHPDDLWQRMRIVAAGLSRREVARRTHTHGETVRRYFKGTMPPVRFIIEFCRAFRVSSDWLLEGLGPRERARRLGRSG